MKSAARGAGIRMSRNVIPDDEKLRRFLAASAVGYAIAGAAMLFRRKGFLADMKRIDGRETAPEIFPELSVAYMSTIAAVAWEASRDRQRAAQMVKPLLVAKAVTTGLFAFQFARTRRRAFLLSALVDGGLLAATVALMSKAGARPQLKVIDNVRRLRAS